MLQGHSYFRFIIFGAYARRFGINGKLRGSAVSGIVLMRFTNLWANNMRMSVAVDYIQ